MKPYEIELQQQTERRFEQNSQRQSNEYSSSLDNSIEGIDEILKSSKSKSKSE